MDLEFGELKNDSNFVSKVQSVADAIARIEETIKNSGNMNSEELTVEEKIKIDLFLTYATNSLFFMHLKVEGENTNSHGIRDELSRVKDAIQRQKDIHDHKTIRPVIKQDAAKRMVRGGLYDFKAKNVEYRSKKIHINGNPNPQNRKRKFTDD